MSDNRGIGTRRKGKKPKEGHASSSSQRAVATGTQRLDISNVEPEEELEWGKIKILAESGVVNSGRSVKGKETMKKPDGEKGKEVGSPAKKQKQHGDIQSSSEPSRKIKIMAESGVINSGRSVKGKETMKKPDSEKGKEVGSSAKKQKQQSYGDIQNSSEQRRRFVRARAFKLGPWLKFSKPCTCEYLVSRGWEGGGLGLRGDGIIDPIKAFQRPFDDQCFWDFRYEEKLWGFGYEEKLWGFGYEEKHGGRREERRKRRKEEEEKRREEEVKKREKKQMEKERQKGKEKRYPQVKIFCWPKEKKEKEKEKEKQKEKEKEKQKEKEKEKPSLSLQAYESEDEV